MTRGAPVAFLAAAAGVAVLLTGCAVRAQAGTAAAAPRTFASVRELIGWVAGQATTGTGGWLGRPGAALRFREVDYYATVYNAQSPRSFVAFATTTRDLTVELSSAATVTTVSGGTPRVTGSVERARWQAAGSPQLAGTPSAGRVVSAPPGTYSFVPQGRPLAYAEVSSLPATPQGVLAAIRTHSGSTAAVTLLLRQFAFLLAVAPLAPETRSAAWHALTLLPELRLCGTTVDIVGRTGWGLCADTAARETEIVVDPAAGTVLQVEERVRAPSSWFPGLPPDSLIDANAFMPAP
jgi:hypothetical protein